MHAPPSKSDNSFAFALLVGTLAAFSVFKSTVIGPYRLDDLLVGLGVEACVLGWLWWLSARCQGLLMGYPNLARRVVFYPAFYFIAGLIFSYTFFFDAAVERRFSLLDVNSGGMLYFFTNVLPARGFAWLLGLMAASHGVAWWLQQRSLQPSARPALIVLLIASVATTAAARHAPRVATPLYDIGYDVWELASTPHVDVDARTRPYRPVAGLDKSARAPMMTDTPFKRVFVLVMETTTSKMFDEEEKTWPADSFFARERGHLRSFSRYFPNNQDSRTGLLNLMGSRLIPYEAYTDEGVAKYAYLKHETSLIDRFAALGYRSAFAVSQSDLEPVITELPWDEKLMLSPADIEREQKTKLCFNPYEFEHGCEDLALLPKVLDFLARNERAFVLQEMIWGHASEYNEASGLSTTAYYAKYLDALVGELARRGMLDDTLIAVTSDHGFRSKGLQSRLDAYRIPLMLYATRFSASDEPRLLSHLDFKDILFDAMQPGSVRVDHNEVVLIQGPTGTQMTAALTDQGGFLLFKTRGSIRLLLEERNLAARGSGEAASLVKMFDDYRTQFEARGGDLARLRGVKESGSSQRVP